MCMYVYMYVYVCVYVFACMCMCVKIWVIVCICVCIYAFRLQFSHCCQVYGRLKNMTSHVSDRDKEQVVIDLDNLHMISSHPQKCMGVLPQELNMLFSSVSHCVARILTACTSYARAPPLQIMFAGHACARILSSIAAGTSDTQNSPNSIENNLVSTGSTLMTAMYAGLLWFACHVPHVCCLVQA